MATKNLTGTRKVVVNALKSGVVDPKLTMETLVNNFESNIDEVAGYVAAWDKYVVVVAHEIEDILVNNPLERRLAELEKKVK